LHRFPFGDALDADLHSDYQIAGDRLEFNIKRATNTYWGSRIFGIRFATRLGMVAIVVADFCRVNCKKSNEINDVFSLA
jgi:hypothetical protein